jgi:hypothetical protein
MRYGTAKVISGGDMQRTNIYLDERQLRSLKHLAAEQRQSMADLVRSAIDDYLEKRIVDEVWRTEWTDLLAQSHSRVPTAIAPDEIEDDITQASAEVRQARHASRRR